MCDGGQLRCGRVLHNAGANDGLRYDNEAFVVSEVHGVWGRALEVPGTGAQNTGKLASVTAVSRAAPGKCSAGGWFLNTKTGYETFVVSKS